MRPKFNDNTEICTSKLEKPSVKILDFRNSQKVAFLAAEIVYSVYYDHFVYSGFSCASTAKIVYSDSTSNGANTLTFSEFGDATIRT